MTGGPSHIDTWDPKPHQPYENRGPFSPIQTSVPGTIICEHLPLQAAMMDKFTILRSVDPRKSSHEPNQVFQTGHLEATPRTNPKGGRWPPSDRLWGSFTGRITRRCPPTSPS